LLSPSTGFYWADHLPPHFHAKYTGDEAVIAIRTGEALRGSLPRRALSLVDEWRKLHETELMENWDAPAAAPHWPTLQDWSER